MPPKRDELPAGVLPNREGPVDVGVVLPNKVVEVGGLLLPKRDVVLACGVTEPKREVPGAVEV